MTLIDEVRRRLRFVSLVILLIVYHNSSEYAWVVNLEGYDRISQYYFRPGDYNTDSNEEDNSSGDGEDGEVED
jgi:hypothetical protein